MPKNSAKIIEYKDFNKNKLIVCPKCNWKGTAEGNIEIYEQLFDVSCPKCDKMLLIVKYPSAKS